MHSDVLRGLLTIANGESALGRGFYEQVKSAAIFGASTPNAVLTPHPGIDNKTRLKQYESYLRTKADEGATGALTSGLVGGALGAGFGALVSGASRRSLAGPAAVGGLAGGVIGAALGIDDSRRVRAARAAIAASRKDPRAIQDAMANELASDFNTQRARERNRDFNMALLAYRTPYYY